MVTVVPVSAQGALTWAECITSEPAKHPPLLASSVSIEPRTIRSFGCASVMFMNSRGSMFTCTSVMFRPAVRSVTAAQLAGWHWISEPMDIRRLSTVLLGNTAVTSKRRRNASGRIVSSREGSSSSKAGPSSTRLISARTAVRAVKGSTTSLAGDHQSSSVIVASAGTAPATTLPTARKATARRGPRKCPTFRHPGAALQPEAGECLSLGLVAMCQPKPIAPDLRRWRP